MNYYELNPNVIIRFEFFGGLLHFINNAEEFELNFANTIFLKALNKGFSYEDSEDIVEVNRLSAWATPTNRLASFFVEITYEMTTIFRQKTTKNRWCIFVS